MNKAEITLTFTEIESGQYSLDCFVSMGDSVKLNELATDISKALLPHVLVALKNHFEKRKEHHVKH